MKKALLLIDIQNDFCNGGSLSVPNANDIIPYVNELICSNKYDTILATVDHHPKNHSSFKSNSENGIWPNHCIQGTYGAMIHKEINEKKIQKLIFKGEDPSVDSYSGFFDNNRQHKTDLDFFLKENNIKELTIVGLALDYCVKATALDAISLGYIVIIELKGTRAVNISPDDGEHAIKELMSHGVIIK